LLLSCALALGAQSKKKVLVLGQPDEVIADWRTVSNKLEIVSVTPETVMNRIARRACLRRRHQARLGRRRQETRVGADHQRRRGDLFAHVRL
jgi:hypothetical protein